MNIFVVLFPDMYIYKKETKSGFEVLTVVIKFKKWPSASIAVIFVR